MDSTFAYTLSFAAVGIAAAVFPSEGWVAVAFSVLAEAVAATVVSATRGAEELKSAGNSAPPAFAQALSLHTYAVVATPALHTFAAVLAFKPRIAHTLSAQALPFPTALPHALHLDVTGLALKPWVAEALPKVADPAPIAVAGATH